RMGVEREPAPLGQLVGRSQVDDGAQADVAHYLEVGLGEAVEAVGTKQRPPLGDLPVSRVVPAEGAKVERSLQSQHRGVSSALTLTTVPTLGDAQGSGALRAVFPRRGLWSRSLPSGNFDGWTR